MQIELTGHAKEVIESLLASGDFTSADEAVDFALRLYSQDAPSMESLQAKLQEGLDDVAAGRVSSFETDGKLKEFFDDVKRRGRERLAENNRQ